MSCVTLFMRLELLPFCLQFNDNRWALKSHFFFTSCPICIVVLQVTLSEDTVFYRVYGGDAGKIGRYMTAVPQNGGVQSQIDLALNPDWGNTAQFVTTVTVPKGTTIYVGTTAPQIINGGAGMLCRLL